ncbi:hypothetical protein [Streptomyces sp. NPDC055036]
MTSVAAVSHAGHTRRLLKDMTGLTEEPKTRAEDVAAALSLLRVAHADIEPLEGTLLLAARSTSSHTGKPLLTCKEKAAAPGTESEQAAQGRYRRMPRSPGTSGRRRSSAGVLVPHVHAGISRSSGAVRCHTALAVWSSAEAIARACSAGSTG